MLWSILVCQFAACLAILSTFLVKLDRTMEILTGTIQSSAKLFSCMFADNNTGSVASYSNMPQPNKFIEPALTGSLNKNPFVSL